MSFGKDPELNGVAFGRGSLDLEPETQSPHMKKIVLSYLFVLTSVFTFAQTGLVINEIDYDQPGLDSAEFIELYNAGSSAVNLADYSVVLINCNNLGFTAYATITLPAQSLASGAYFVICSPFGTVSNCNQNFTHTYSFGHLQNGSPDLVAIQENVTQNYIDFVSYEGTCASPYTGNGVPLAESDTVVGQDTINGIPQAPLKTYGISRYPNGTDTNNDSIDFKRACITPGAANVNIASNCAGTSGIQTNNGSSFGMMVYPNPSRGLVQVDFRGRSVRNGNLAVIDMLGNEVKNFRINSSNSKFSIDLSELQSGIYFIKAVTDQGMTMQRVVIKK